MYVYNVNRRSAVERLEETKANYVKTESVLDSKQNFEHSSKLRVSNGPKVDLLLQEHMRSIYNCQSIIQYVHAIDLSNNSNKIIKDAAPKTNIFENKTKFQETENVTLQRKRVSNVFDVSANYSDDQVKLRPLCAEKSPLKHSKVSNTDSCSNANVVKKASSKSWQKSADASDYNYTAIEFHDKPENRSTQLSENEEHSSAASRDSFSGDDVMELDDKQHGSRTSDYVSRSSSFKCSLSSDRVKNLVKSFESRNNPSPSRTSRSVSRSKSDVSSRFSKDSHEVTTVGDIELERFFNTMGHDTGMWNNLTIASRSPVHFFDSISSLNSEDHHSSVCSEDSNLEVCREGLKNSDLQKHAPNETSIVEKNARVVKWLYNCHNVSRKSTS